jgi:signal transduction histidine kinase
MAPWDLAGGQCRRLSAIISTTIRIHHAILALCVAGAAIAGTAEAGQEQSGQKRVLVIHSTRRDSLISEAAERILMQRLDAAFGVQLDYYAEYIDPARFKDHDYSGFHNAMRGRYLEFRPNVVIAIEDAAIEFVTRYRDTLLGEAPVVFFTRTPDAARPANSTGVVEPINFARTIELATALQPEVTEIVVISGSSARDRTYEAVAREQFQRLSPRLTFTYLSGLSMPALERRLGSLPPTAVAYPLLVSQGSDGNFRPQEINDRIEQMANRPTYGWHERHFGGGYVGGSLLHLAPGLTLLAERAVRILGGESADRIEVARPQLQTDRVDGRQLRRWGISEARVPAGVVIEFRDPTLWQRYRPYLIAAGVLVAAQSALIAGLLLQGRRRRHAERELRNSRDQLTQSYERIRDIGGRLLTAQEGERSRIARELHDDISQQMALLEFDLHEAGSDAKALARLSNVARSVHELSHRLHPAHLTIMGLVGSLNALQREHVESGLPVHFVHKDVPDNLSPELALCLFRVVQEALHNAAKYSDASEVTVELTRTAGALLLTVTDDGVGFDVEKAWGKGLGLISIRERVEASGGTVSVESHPDSGTRFVIEVPV